MAHWHSSCTLDLISAFRTDVLLRSFSLSISKQNRIFQHNDRGDIEDDWSHDKFEGEGAESKPATAVSRPPKAASVAEGHQIKIENLFYDVTEEDLKVRHLEPTLDAGQLG